LRPKATTVTHWVDIVDTNGTCLCLCHPEVTFFEDKTRQRQSLSLPPTHPLLLSLFQFNDEIKGLDIEIFFYKFTMITCYIHTTINNVNCQQLLPVAAMEYTLAFCACLGRREKWIIQNLPVPNQEWTSI